MYRKSETIMVCCLSTRIKSFLNEIIPKQSELLMEYCGFMLEAELKKSSFMMRSCLVWNMETVLDFYKWGKKERCDSLTTIENQSWLFLSFYINLINLSILYWIHQNFYTCVPCLQYLLIHPFIQHFLIFSTIQGRQNSHFLIVRFVRRKSIVFSLKAMKSQVFYILYTCDNGKFWIFLWILFEGMEEGNRFRELTLELPIIMREKINRRDLFKLDEFQMRFFLFYFILDVLFLCQFVF